MTVILKTYYKKHLEQENLFKLIIKQSCNHKMLKAAASILIQTEVMCGKRTEKNAKWFYTHLITVFVRQRALSTSDADSQTASLAGHFDL